MVVKNTKLINASPEQVWEVMRDIERWPSWTPTVTNITRLDDAPFAVGCIAEIKQPGLPECQWKVVDLTDGEGFTWETRVFGISMAATHEIRPHQVSDHEFGTKNTLQLTVRGIVAKLLWPIIRGSLQRTLDQENKGLKTKLEE